MTIFRLNITQIEKTCDFKLSWGTEQQQSQILVYPESLKVLYENWQRAYLSFYNNLLPADIISAEEPGGAENTSPLRFIKRIFSPAHQMRARVEDSGTMPSSLIDWHARLVQAEAALKNEFHHWLRSAELHEIRAAITRAAANSSKSVLPPEEQIIEVFITCNNLELEKLPWETWEIGAESGLSHLIRISRIPVKISEESVPPRRGRTRILAILGDDRGLDFKDDKLAVLKLSRIADIKFIGWQPGKDINELKQEISQALVSPQGWDILFFAGHSNETALTGGELGIAPGAFISISEIEQQLREAKQRGLQFALFNSCSGINIAQSLIDLGFSQVVVMREPIHNQVAQKFLRKFMQELATHCDVHSAMQAAVGELKENYEITYPSAYLIPSLYRRPSAPLFRIKSWEWLQEILPTRKQAIAFSALIFLSLLTYVQNLLLEPRLLVQSIYRDMTAQVPSTTKPPVLLIDIDTDSIKDINSRKIGTIDRKYIANIVEKLQFLQPKVVGIDFVFDGAADSDEDKKLAQAVSALVTQNTWLVFGASRTPETGEVTTVTDKITSLKSSLQGHVNFNVGYVELLPENLEYAYNCPFAYLLVLAHILNQKQFTDLPQPNLPRKTEFGKELFGYVNRQTKYDSNLAFLRNQQFGRQWLQPLIDYSIPPNQVYERIPAWKFLNDPSLDIKSLKQHIVIIAPGGYDRAGILKPGEDNFSIPPAVNYWYNQPQLQKRHELRGVFTGSQIHAYTIHNLLNRRLVVPIPDWWTIIIAVLLGRVTIVMLKEQPQRRHWLALSTLTIVYGLASLQIYISGAVLLPWLLPSAALWVNFIPSFTRRKYYG